MQSLIKDLFNNCLAAAPDYPPKDEEYLELKDKITKELDCLMTVIPEDHAHHMLELESLNSHAANIYATECFINGFKLGANMIMEILDSNETP